MIEFMSVFSRLYGGNCGSFTGGDNEISKQRVKFPKKGMTTSAKTITSPRRSAPPVLRYDESRDDIFIVSKKSLIDVMASYSEESGERDPCELLLEDETPLVIMERRKKNHHSMSSSFDHSDEVTEADSVESHAMNFQNLHNVRRRGLLKIGKYLPKETTEHQNNNNYYSDRRLDKESYRLSKLLEKLTGSKHVVLCPLCSGKLRYVYISSPRTLADINEGRDSTRTKLLNLMPPHCKKCQAHLIFDHNEAKTQMIENIQRWLDNNFDDQTRGKIIFNSSTPRNHASGTSPHVMMQQTPKQLIRGSVSISFHDVDDDSLLSAESKLSETLGPFYSGDKESIRYLERHSQKDLFSSDSNDATTMDGINIVRTESEERQILQQYSATKAVATKSISKHLKKGYDLTTHLCDRCQMPMMKLGDGVVYCIVCPVVDKQAKRNAKQKRKKMRNVIEHPEKNEEKSHASEQQKPERKMYRLTALEEGRGFVCSPRNQDINLAVSSCMSSDGERKTHGIDSRNMPSAACKLQSNHPDHHKLLEQSSSSGLVSNDNSVGIECTYSVHQFNVVSMPCATDDASSPSNTSANNIIIQTSTLSETQCPRNLPSSEMIWHHVQMNAVPTSTFNKTQSDFDKTCHGISGVEHERREHNVFETSTIEDNHTFKTTFVEAADRHRRPDFLATKVDPNQDDVVFPESTVKINKISFESFCGRSDEHLSKAVRGGSDQMRGDQSTQRTDFGSSLGNTHQKSFEGPLLTPDLFSPSHAGGERQDTNSRHHNEQPHERESNKTFPVFANINERSPRTRNSQHEILTPLFPSPNVSNRKCKDQYNDDALLNEEEINMSKETIVSDEENIYILFPPPDESPLVHIAPHDNATFPVMMTTLNNEISTSSLPSGVDANRDQVLERNQAAKDPSPGRLSTPRPIIDRVRRTQPRSVDVLSHKAMDPPGKRITKQKRREGDQLDPPAHNEPFETDTPKRNNFGPKRMQNCSPFRTRTPNHNSFIYPKRHCIGFSFHKQPEPKSKEYRSSPRKQSQTSCILRSDSSTERNMLLSIPSWVNDEINAPIKSAHSEDSSMEKLIQQIDHLEADFGSIVASVNPLETMKRICDRKSPIYTENKISLPKKGKQVSLEQVTDLNTPTAFQSLGRQKSLNQTNNKTEKIAISYESDADNVLNNVTHQIRHIHNQIERIDSSEESDDCELGADSQEEMLELINRLNNAAQSLRSSVDFHD